VILILLIFTLFYQSRYLQGWSKVFLQNKNITTKKTYFLLTLASIEG